VSAFGFYGTDIGDIHGSLKAFLTPSARAADGSALPEEEINIISRSVGGLRPDGTLHVEVAKQEAGTAWVVEACKKAHADTGKPIVVDPRSPTGGLLDRLRAEGIPLTEVSTATFVQACAALQDDVLNDRVKHIDQQHLNAAVAGAEVRTVGEAWAFSARTSSIDITPLLAVTLAASAARDVDPPFTFFLQ
jgi:hypothetical protein